jgi:hypothetical protein
VLQSSAQQVVVVECGFIVGEHREWGIAVRERMHGDIRVDGRVRNVQVMANGARRNPSAVQMSHEARHRGTDVRIERADLCRRGG